MSMFKDEDSNESAGNEKWRATHFINLDMPAKTKGGTRKVGVIKLYNDERHPLHQQLVAFCEEHEDNAQLIVNDLVARFNSAETDVEETGYILPVSAAVATEKVETTPEEVSDTADFG